MIESLLFLREHSNYKIEKQVFKDFNMIGMIDDDVISVLSVPCNKDEILERQIVFQDLDRDDFYNMHLIDIGLNSLNFIRFIVELEKALNIEILDSDLVLENFKTIDTLMKMLNKYFSHNYCNIKKVIISDCDNVLWHGIAGEEMFFRKQRM